MHLWPSSGFTRYAYEVKVSRSDFLREKKNPLKTRAAYLMSNYFSFVAPMGMIKPEEIPVEAGLIEVDAEERLHDTVPAPYRDVPEPNVLLMAAVCRRANAIERKQVEALTLQYLEGQQLGAIGFHNLADVIDQIGEQRQRQGFWHHVEKVFADDEAKRMVNTMMGDIMGQLKIKVLKGKVFVEPRGLP